MTDNMYVAKIEDVSLENVVSSHVYLNCAYIVDADAGTVTIEKED